MKQPSDNKESSVRIDQLKESERLYRTLVEDSPDIIYRTDLKGKITFISKTIYKLSGYTREEAVGMDMAKEAYLYPEDREEFLIQLQKYGKVKNFEAQMKRKDGSVYWLSTNAHFYKDESGNIIGVEGVTRDVTALKEIENELSIYREHLEELVEERTAELQKALEKVKTLSGLLPICASCKKIRDDKGYWNQIESYIQKHSDAEFSHGMCPECSDKLYGDQDWYIEMKKKKGYNH